MLKLVDLVGSPTAFGNTEGRQVFQKLLTELDSHPGERVAGISLEGIERTDASFPRESVVSLAKSRCGEKGFYLQDFDSKDLMDNWDYAAKAKGFTMIVITADSYELIGNEISAGLRELLDLVMNERTITTSRVAEALDVSAQEC